MSSSSRHEFTGSDPARRAIGWVVVLAVHLLAGWALVSGTAREQLDLIRKPLETLVIQEITVPPPPPSLPRPPPPPPPTQAPKPKTMPPEQDLPEVTTQPPYVPPAVLAPPATLSPLVIAATPEPPPAEIAPPAALSPMVVAATPEPPPADPSPPPVPTPTPAPVAAAEPVRTEIGVVCPKQVPPDMPARALRNGIEGVVRVKVLIRDGRVADVEFLSGDSVFRPAVREALMKYRCNTIGGDQTAIQEFAFRLEK